jgi:hypothetical protein
MKRFWTGCLGLLLSLGACRVEADEIVWRPVREPAASAPAGPTVILHAPRPLDAPPMQPVAYSPAVPVASQAPDRATTNGTGIVRAQAPGDPLYGIPQGPPPGSPGFQPPPPPPYPPPGPSVPNSDTEKLLCGVSVSNSGGGGGGIFDQGKHAIQQIPDALGGAFGGNSNRCCLQSDHAFDVFCSPVTNPFFMHDPRSLTEIKPLLIYEHVPASNPVFQGGNVWFYGVQGSVAITERFSIVLNKLGFITLQPHNTSNGVQDKTGFAEVAFSPQYTIIRNDCSGTLLAAGLTFEIPIGSGRVFQDTGDLSLIPYVSFGQNFFKTTYGSFNFLNTTGYSFATDNRRNDFFYSSFHLDFDVLNLHKIYPLMELNWTHWTTNSEAPRFYGFSGGDLVNFGNDGIAGHDDLSLAFGARYKFAEWFQVGTAVEFPLVNRSRGLMDYRLTFDLIFRY